MSRKLPEGEGKRVPLNMRTTREVRDALERAAEQSGRSLAQEVEHRLERSFWEDGLRVDILSLENKLRDVVIEAMLDSGR